ncbi:MAG: Protein GrpE [Microgenomates group bacterium GW2011_GWC1_37_8]|uniref:Protein GrpE n=1 Tax=Candidatus Woesebacteria bacterium GW2011_GWB1_38_8 TaxID=1618570 RepID=A0A0G0P9R3_9BACT|nr:MAG: Protein GrpE [Microgenomates group bacterium GW2011_GWC1_37_8]KKQ86066.1 MAG: Protein GrpE [Candidatus Woesebacteria bacterium GW2011_GWB1_38_8]
MTKRKASNLQKDLENLKSQLARALADYDNLSKRVEFEKELWIKFSSERIITSLIPVLDMLEKAQSHLKDQGLAIATGEFKKVLNEEGLEEILPVAGDKFDEKNHEAIETLEGGTKGSIAETVLPGWKFKAFHLEGTNPEGKIVRPAKVKVYND